MIICGLSILQTEFNFMSKNTLHQMSFFYQIMHTNNKRLSYCVLKILYFIGRAGSKGLWIRNESFKLLSFQKSSNESETHVYIYIQRIFISLWRPNYPYSEQYKQYKNAYIHFIFI